MKAIIGIIGRPKGREAMRRPTYNIEKNALPLPIMPEMPIIDETVNKNCCGGWR
jgi:hypothetical protein